MSRIVALEMVSLDGVMQAPGRADEDLRGGFAHGGWATPFAAMQDLGGERGESGGLLFGRRTYEDFYSVWPQRKGNPYSAILDDARKYVASTTLREPLPWKNSTLLPGDAADAVARLRDEPGKDLVILGSGVLVQSLLRAGLVDELTLLIHPLVLGRGRRLFPDEGSFAPLRLVTSRTTRSGVVIATWGPATPIP